MVETLPNRVHHPGWTSGTHICDGMCTCLHWAAGSGKTLAFALPVLLRLRALQRQGGDEWPAGIKAVVLSPTHELAAQQARVFQ